MTQQIPKTIKQLLSFDVFAYTPHSTFIHYDAIILWTLITKTKIKS